MLVKFTDWRGDDVWVNPLQVRTVRSEREYERPGSRDEPVDVTIIVLASGSSGPTGGALWPKVSVRLPVEEVVAMLDDATPGTLT